MRIITLLIASLTLLVSVAATADVDIQPDEYVVFYHHDVLGSPVTATNELGQAIWHERTESYGKSEGRFSNNGNAFGDNALPAANSRQGYTGHTLDNSAGLTYMKARYYDHNIGRFLSNDPVGFNISNPETFGRYVYAANNPYYYTDPTGRSKADLWNLIVNAGLESSVTIKNKSLAGKIHSKSGVPFDNDGFADFSGFAKEIVDDVQWTGDRAKDRALANKSIGVKQTPDGHIWEHARNGTLQLVPEDIHSMTGHTGGFKLFSTLVAAGGSVVSTVAKAAQDDPFSFALDIFDPGMMGNLGDGMLREGQVKPEYFQQE